MTVKAVSDAQLRLLRQSPTRSQALAAKRALSAVAANGRLARASPETKRSYRNVRALANRILRGERKMSSTGAKRGRVHARRKRFALGPVKGGSVSQQGPFITAADFSAITREGEVAIASNDIDGALAVLRRLKVFLATMRARGNAQAVRGYNNLRAKVRRRMNRPARALTRTGVKKATSRRKSKRKKKGARRRDARGRFI